MTESGTTPKVALITGAAKRIGATIAEKLHSEGMNVVIHYHTSKKEADNLAEALNQKRPHSAIPLSANLCDETERQSLAKEAHHAWGRLDVLINNAALFYPTPFGDAKSSDWDNLINSNVKSAFFLIQAVYPFLKETHGMVINMTDATTTLRRYTIYSLSKAALSAMTSILAEELALDDIAVNTVAPGPTLPPEGKSNAALNKPDLVLGGLDEVVDAVWHFIATLPAPTGKAYVVERKREASS